MKRTPGSFALLDHIYQLKLDAPKIEEIRATLDFDPVNLRKNPLGELEDDPVLLVNCCWLLAGDQHPDITATRFGEALVGEPIGGAERAMVEAIAFFFQEPKRSALLSMWETQQKMNADVLAATIAKYQDPHQRQETEHAIAEILDQQIKNQLMRSRFATNSLESSESDPKD